MPHHFDTILYSVRRVLGGAGVVLLGGALAWAPIAAFTGDMLRVTKLALIGVALLIVARLLPRRTDTTDDKPNSSSDGS